ncbi:hypothetical protein LEP1GSC060_1742 [Leptospira weilii serovar Ranarum str. ICFT]|uniref:RHS repeat protein n=1 Tax=Leptospira weilii serovar Ranarum str. ICFT TaxID=1218598 RepID=N1WGK4_9LEPT|nr:hypothetical protein LEP1GSC060_1742 [Leptospira weilii serovar Ranarum str. ICFT]
MSCFNLPQKVEVTAGGPTVTYNCSVSGKVYTCVPSDGGNSIVRTYASAAGAKLGVIDPPGTGNAHAQRGLASSDGGATTYTYDSSNQLVSVASPAVTTYSNYDTNGFPQSNSAGRNITYTYTAGSKIPTTSADGAFTYTYDSKGWGTKMSGFGMDTIAVNSGSLEICD